MGSQQKSQPQLCACGCGEMTEGGTFRPGHDARLRSKFLDRVEDGDESAISEYLDNWPNLADQYVHTEESLRACLGQGRGRCRRAKRPYR
jgi:hypothetical protein